MTILVPDPHYADGGDLERATAGPGVTWHVSRGRECSRKAVETALAYLCEGRLRNCVNLELLADASSA